MGFWELLTTGSWRGKQPIDLVELKNIDFTMQVHGPAWYPAINFMIIYRNLTNLA